MRRRRAGGSSGIALVLVGALGYSVLGGSSGVDRIEPTREDRRERFAPQPGGIVQESETPRPTASAAVPGTSPTQVPGGTGTGPGVRPSVGPTSVVVHPNPSPTRRPNGTTTRQYAARPKIDRTDPYTNPDLVCVNAPEQAWCTSGIADASGAMDGIYRFTYTVCRRINTGTGTLSFDTTQEADFSATDVEHDDTVWTWSAGQRPPRDDHEVVINAGNCIDWTVTWNGLDDYGQYPPRGEYTMTARLLAREAVPAVERSFQHD
jgi:hypothetical protein